ncbi:MAG: sugar nucleotide-binding protein [Alcaligenaceae bacterium]|nr:sugar nucleotide-binding protein [Alcaligenaceae bacterium]
MKILILGTTGQLAQAIALTCKDLGLYYEQTTHQASEYVNDVFTHYLDFLSLPKDLSFLSHYDVIINTAAYTDVGRSGVNKQACFQINAYAVQSMVNALTALKVAPLWIQFSTDYVYGHGKKSCAKTENEPIAPLNVYGDSKALADQWLLASGLPVWIFRTAGLYDDLGINFQTKILQQLKDGKCLSVCDDQYSHRTRTIWVARLVCALLRDSARHPTRYGFEDVLPYGVYHLVEGDCRSWYEWAVDIAIEHGFKPSMIQPLNTSKIANVVRPQYGHLSINKFLKQQRLSDESLLLFVSSCYACNAGSSVRL